MKGLGTNTDITIRKPPRSDQSRTSARNLPTSSSFGDPGVCLTGAALLMVVRMNPPAPVSSSACATTNVIFLK